MYPGTARPIAPWRTSAPDAAMKMWIISVAPMPSVSSTPVASRQSVRVASGSASPAETEARSDCVENRAGSFAIASAM